MRRRRLRFFLVVSLCLGNACAHHEEVKSPDPVAFQMQDQREALLREARSEAERLRSELASARIAGAKLAAELKALREEAEHLRAREAELGAKVQQLQEDVVALQNERDALMRRNAELQARSSALPALEQMTDQLDAQQALLQRLAETVHDMAADMMAVKQELHETQQRVASSSGSTGASGSAGRDRKHPGRDVRTVTVKPRDTLWRIARAHGVSVEQLQRLNGLTSSVIRVGQVLKVPVPETARDDRMPSAKGPSNHRPASRDASSRNALRPGAPGNPAPAPTEFIHPKQG